MSPQTWFTQSMSFCIVLVDILELMGNPTPETVPWFHVATSHCADSNQRGSPPAPALSSKKGQKEISLGQGPHCTTGLLLSIPEGSTLRVCAQGSGNRQTGH